MEIKEMAGKVYQKHGITVGDRMMEYIVNNPERRESIKCLYKQEEIESMNYILGKSLDNTIFTKNEIKLCSKIDLFDRKTVGACKHIYEKERKEVKV